MIAVIPARGGSTRIPRKNIKLFHGKPIIQYSIETANRSGLFDKIYVSTEDTEIATIAKLHGAEVIDRPASLSVNDVGTQEVMRHACMAKIGEEYRSLDIACCIYSTSPLMACEDLIRAHKILLDNRAIKYAFSVGTNPLHDAGQFYFGRISAFINNEPLIAEHSMMIPISKDRVCDINTPSDWAKAEGMYGKLNRGILEGRVRRSVPGKKRKSSQ